MNRYEFEQMMANYAVRHGLSINYLTVRIMYQRWVCGTACTHVAAALEEQKNG